MRERERDREGHTERNSGISQGVRVWGLFVFSLILFRVVGLVLRRRNGTEKGTLLLLVVVVFLFLFLLCHQLGLFGTDLHAIGCGGFFETLNKFCQFFFLSC